MLDPLTATLWTARTATGLYAAFLLQQAWRSNRLHNPGDGRVLWSAACAANLVHVATAVLWFHGGSQRAAWEHTARRTAEVVGVATGLGLVVNYVFAALWTVDVVGNRSGRETTAPAPLRRCYHSCVQVFAAFMYFQAAVVFASAPLRNCSLGLLAAGAMVRFVRSRYDRSASSERL